MKRSMSFLLVLAVALGACARRTPEQQFVSDAIGALGGDRITNARSLSIEGEGLSYNLGQDVRPGEHTQTFAISAYKRTIGLDSPRMRVEQTRTPNFTYFGGQQPQVQVSGLDGGVAYAIAPNGSATRATDVVAAERRAEYYHHPVTLLRAASQPNARVTNLRTEGSERLADIETADGVSLTLASDATSSQPTRIASRAYHPNLGDVVLTSRFSDYRTVGGATLPAAWTTATDDFVTAEMKATNQTFDGDTANLAAPGAAASAPARPAPPAPTVALEEVAPGVWRLAGGSHHSVLVEFADHLKLVEAPQSEPRTLAVIAKAREVRPNKPLTHVINTHHHFDHTAGVRAAIAEGLTVVTQAGNAAFFDEIAKRPHTITPDALTKKPAALKLDPVETTKTFQDAAMTLSVYHVADNPHTKTMLMVHLPKQKLLVEVDAYTPGSAVSPYSANLLENVRKHKLQIDRVVPLHSTIEPFADLVKRATKG